MMSRWTKVTFPVTFPITFTASLAALAALAACSGAALSPSSAPSLSSPPSSAASSSASSPSSSAPSGSSSAQAEAASEPPDGGADAAPASEDKCAAGAPKPDPAFASIALRFEQRPDGTTAVEPEVARRLPAISEDGRTLAILDERESIDAGASLHLAFLDVRTNKLVSFTLWAKPARPTRRPEAQRALDKGRWQSLIEGEIGDEGCHPRKAGGPRMLRLNAAEFEFESENYKVSLLRHTSGGVIKLPVVLQGLPGALGQAAVPTGDVGAPCGFWDHLSTGWVSQDGRVHLFKLGALLGARCDTAPKPVGYSAWVSP